MKADYKSHEYRELRRRLLPADCHYCGEPATTLDHLIPVSLGGTTKDGVVPACATCNRSRGNTGR